MNTTRAVSWSLFGLVSLLTAIFYRYGSAMPGYFTVLILLGITSFVLAFKVLADSGPRLPTLILVAIGLVAGQWWCIDIASLMIFGLPI